MQRADPALFLVVGDHRAQVEARHHVAVEDEERAFNVALDVLDGAGRPERLLFDHVREAQTDARAIAEIRRDRLGQMIGRQDHVLDPRSFDAAQRQLQERHAHDRDHRLRRAVGQRPKPRSLAADQNDCLQSASSHCGPRCAIAPGITKRLFPVPVAARTLHRSLARGARLVALSRANIRSIWAQARNISIGLRSNGLLTPASRLLSAGACSASPTRRGERRQNAGTSLCRTAEYGQIAVRDIMTGAPSNAFTTKGTHTKSAESGSAFRRVLATGQSGAARFDLAIKGDRSSAYRWKQRTGRTSKTGCSKRASFRIAAIFAGSRDGEEEHYRFKLIT